MLSSPTVFGGAKQRVRMEGFPEDTTVAIANQRNEVIYEGEVPNSVRLERFLEKIESREAARYRVRFERPGYKPREVMIDPFYKRSEAIITWIPAATTIYSPISIVGGLVDLSVGSSVGLWPRKLSNLEFAPVSEGFDVPAEPVSGEPEVSREDMPDD